MRRYQRIDLRQFAAQQGIDLDVAFASLRALYADVDARNARNTQHLKLPCHRGCDACCHESVFLTPLEFYYVWDWAQTHLDDATLQHIVVDGLALYEQHRELIEALERPPPNGAADHIETARQLRFRCPLLGADAGCLVYPAREIFARLFGCSFNDAMGVYGCDLVAQRLADQTVTLLPARATARRLHDLPLTQTRQIYPFYLQALYGI